MSILREVSNKLESQIGLYSDFTFLFLFCSYACDICGKQFVRKCHYDSHMLCHSEERRFKCTKCDMAYKLNKHLRDHMKKSHQNETDLSALINSIHTDDDMISQKSILHH